MKEILKATENFTTVDKFNTKMTLALKDAAGKVLTVSKVAVGKDLDQEGNETVAAAFITEEGVYGTISDTVIELADTLVDIINEQGDVQVKVESRKANSGRDYLALVLIG